jgi:adenine-specific DNA-methyltransferase
MLEELFPAHEVHFITIVHNPRGAQGTNFSYVHEYAFFIIPRDQKSIADRTIEEEDIWWSNLRNWGGESERHNAKTCFYPIFVKDGEVIGFGDVAPDNAHPQQTEEVDDHFAIYPIDNKGVERKWRYGRDSVESIKHLLQVKKGKNGYEVWIGKDFGQHKTVWNDTRYDANEYGTKIVKDLVPNCPFKYPKSLWTVYDCVKAIVEDKPEAVVLDFFAGSGTTAHALDELNNVDKGSRKFLMVEQLEYVNECTKARILEARRRLGTKSELVYCELAEWNEALGSSVRKAKDDAALERVIADIRTNGYWRYKADQSLWDWDAFGALTLDQRKAILLDSLDANHLYVNYGDIADPAYGITGEDTAVNRAFYEGEA